VTVSISNATRSRRAPTIGENPRNFDVILSVILYFLTSIARSSFI